MPMPPIQPGPPMPKEPFNVSQLYQGKSQFLEIGMFMEALALNRVLQLDIVRNATPEQRAGLDVVILGMQDIFPPADLGMPRVTCTCMVIDLTIAGRVYRMAIPINVGTMLWHLGGST